MTAHEIAIHADYLAHALRRAELFKRKAHRFGMVWDYDTRPFTSVRQHADGRSWHSRGQSVVLLWSDPMPRIDGWTILATVTRSGAIDELHTMAAGDTPEHRAMVDALENGHCDQCHTTRDRRRTALVFNPETRQYRQLGQSCLRDYVRSSSSEAAFGFMECDPLDWLDDGVPSGSVSTGPTLVDLPHLLATVLADMELRGGYTRWTEGGPMSTRDRVLDAYFFTVDAKTADRRMDQRAYEDDVLVPLRELASTIWQRDADQIAQIIEWGKALEGATDFHENARRIAQAGAAVADQFGFACGMVPGHKTDMDLLERKQKQAAERAAEREGIKAEYLAQPGDRIRLTISKVLLHRSFDGHYGAFHVWVLRTACDHVVVLKGGWNKCCMALTDLMADDVDSVTIKATVKAHDEYDRNDGTMDHQTIIQRPALVK